MYHFPASSERRQQWCQILQVQEKGLSKDARICSRHFVDGGISTLPTLSIGKRFAFPKKWPIPICVPVPPRKQQKLMKRSLAESPTLYLTFCIIKWICCVCFMWARMQLTTTFMFRLWQGKKRCQDHCKCSSFSLYKSLWAGERQLA